MCRVILFRTTEKLISAASWYDGGFRAQTVAYTISYLSALVQESGLSLNFDLIWELQEIPDSLVDMLKLISEQVYKKITHPAAGYANITQWTKNPLCWANVKEIDVDFPELDQRLFIAREEKNYQIKESKVIKAVDKGIEAQIFVLKVSSETWTKLYKYYFNYKGTKSLSTMQLDLVSKMASGKISYPSEKQSKILHQIYNEAKSDGVDLG